ncbi:Aminopeptidase N [Gossypium arboreum]|uniref:Aminopeptidase N n=1 Tax=Gossypium arboreum TaxID=29729 RepID=A0A0B0NAF6_GOSAR|nr:Aminopeptidase N [Gossypium arboreum]
MPRKRLRDLSIIQNPPNLEETKSDHQIAIGSSNVPTTVGEPVEIQRYLGIIAQNANLLLINYKSWHHMLDSNKNQALDNIMEKLKEKREEYEVMASSESSQYMLSANQAQAEV